MRLAAVCQNLITSIFHLVFISFPHLNDRHVGQIEDFNARRKAAVKRQAPGEETRALKTKAETEKTKNYMQELRTSFQRYGKLEKGVSWYVNELSGIRIECTADGLIASVE